MDLGSAKNPIYTMQAEPTLKSQIWRTVRTLAVMFVVISGLGALMEEKGLSRGILNTPDMRPTIDGKTKFADVKGVDEAKVRGIPFPTVLQASRLILRLQTVRYKGRGEKQEQEMDAISDRLLNFEPSFGGRMTIIISVCHY